MYQRTRRQFLEDSMFAAAAAVAAGSTTAALAGQDKLSNSPNEKLGVAVVGCGGRGGSHLNAFSTRPDTEVLYVVDIDDPVPGLQFRWCRDKNWKIILPAKKSQPVELFDLATDPHETKNVAAEHPQIVARLFKLTNDWWPVKTGSP